MRNRILKLLLLVIFPLIPFMGITNANYIDTEESTLNNFRAAKVDIELRKENNEELGSMFFDKKKLKKEEIISKKLKVINEGSIPFYYQPKFAFINDSLEVCNEANITAKKDGVEVFNGKISDLSNALTQITGVEDIWEFNISHENENVGLQGKECRFEIKFDAFQTFDSKGFSDAEITTNRIGFAYEPNLSVYHNQTLHKLIFTLSNISNFNEFEYELTYDTDTISDGANGSVTLSGESSKTVQIDLGTESGDVLVPHINPHNFNLNINLTDIDNDAIVLSKQL